MLKALNRALPLLLLLLAVSGGAVSVGFDPNPQVAAPAQNFISILRLDTTTLIHGYSLSVRYDASKISFVSAQRGSLFTGQSIFWWRVNTDTLNIVNVACIITGQGAVTGPGNLLNLTFAAGGENLTQLEVSSIKFYDLSGGYFTNIDTTPADLIIGSQPAYAQARCWLQGPWFQGSMQTDGNALIPLLSPFGADPLAVDAIPPDVVDWALLELSITPGGQAVASRSVWLGADGSLRSPGISFAAFQNLAAGPYYIRIRHRNHLAVESNFPLIFVASGVPNLGDLTLLANINNPANGVDLGGGSFALAAGDANQDGTVNLLDRDFSWRPQAGQNGYLAADLDLDGNVFPTDLNELWRPNHQVLVDPDPGRGGLSLYLANPLLQTEGSTLFLHLDVLAAAELETDRLGTGIVLLDYNPEVFGAALVNAGGLTVTAGELLSGDPSGSYNLISNDNQPGRLAIVFEYTGAAANGVLLSSEPAQILRLKLRVQELSGPSGLAFSPALMQGEQFQADNSSRFNPIEFYDLEYDHLPSPPQNLVLSDQGGALILSWQAIPGCSYNVYETSDPEFGAWTLAASGLSLAYWTDPDPQSRKFYRVTSTKARS